MHVRIYKITMRARLTHIQLLWESRRRLLVDYAINNCHDRTQSHKELWWKWQTIGSGFFECFESVMKQYRGHFPIETPVQAPSNSTNVLLAHWQVLEIEKLCIGHPRDDLAAILLTMLLASNIICFHHLALEALSTSCPDPCTETDAPSYC